MLAQEILERRLVGFYCVNPQNSDSRQFWVGGNLDPSLSLCDSVKMASSMKPTPAVLWSQEPGAAQRLGAEAVGGQAAGGLVGRHGEDALEGGQPGRRERPRTRAVCPLRDAPRETSPLGSDPEGEESWGEDSESEPRQPQPAHPQGSRGSGDFGLPCLRKLRLAKGTPDGGWAVIGWRRAPKD